MWTNLFRFGRTSNRIITGFEGSQGETQVQTADSWTGTGQTENRKDLTPWHLDSDTRKQSSFTLPGCSHIHPDQGGSRGGDHICWHPCKVGFLTRLIACHTFCLWMSLWIQKPYLSRFLSYCGTASTHGLLTFRRGDKLAVWRRSGAAKQILGKIEPAFFRFPTFLPFYICSSLWCSVFDSGNSFLL